MCIYIYIYTVYIYIYISLIYKGNPLRGDFKQETYRKVAL